MARPLRITRAGTWYHLTARGNERKSIYRDDGDRQKFLALLETLFLPRFDWSFLTDAFDGPTILHAREGETKGVSP